MDPVLFGPKAQSIIVKYALKSLLDKGSSADIYQASEDSIYRLSIDAGSHNMIVQGDAKGLQFPRVIHDYGNVGEVDDDDFEDACYWLGEFEMCRKIDQSDIVYKPFVDLIDSAPARDLERPDAIEYLKNYKDAFEKFGLYGTMKFIIDLTASGDVVMDIDVSNFMLNRKGNIVVTDLVYGHSAEFQ